MNYFLFQSLPRYAYYILVKNVSSLRVGSPYPLRSRRLICWPVSPTRRGLARGSPHLLYRTLVQSSFGLRAPAYRKRSVTRAKNYLSALRTYLGWWIERASECAPFWLALSGEVGAGEPPRYLNRPFCIVFGRSIYGLEYNLVLSRRFFAILDPWRLHPSSQSAGPIPYRSITVGRFTASYSHITPTCLVVRGSSQSSPTIRRSKHQQIHQFPPSLNLPPVSIAVEAQKKSVSKTIHHQSAVLSATRSTTEYPVANARRK